MGGAVTGFTKALARERAGALIKAVDFACRAQDAGARRPAARGDPARPGRGRDRPRRRTCAGRSAWSSDRRSQTRTARARRRRHAFVVTGAAGSIVSAITADLAPAARGGDVPPARPRRRAPTATTPTSPASSPTATASSASSPSGSRPPASKPTPKLVERELARIERARAALDAIAAIERAGGTAHWHQVDLTDAERGRATRSRGASSAAASTC